MLFKGLFDNWEDVLEAFSVATGSHVEHIVPLLARYEIDGYDGSALVVFVENGKLYHASGGHCSCFGLEGQFDPEEIPWEIAEKYFTRIHGFSDDELVWIVELVREIVDAKERGDDSLSPLLTWYRLGH